MVLRVCLIVITALLIAAHFLRAGSFLLVALCLLMPLLLFYKRRVSLVLLQISAYAAATSWLWTAYQLVQMRQATAQPWTAAVIILGSVALFSSLSGLLLNSADMSKRYPI